MNIKNNYVESIIEPSNNNRSSTSICDFKYLDILVNDSLLTIWSEVIKNNLTRQNIKQYEDLNLNKNINFKSSLTIEKLCISTIDTGLIFNKYGIDIYKHIISLSDKKIYVIKNDYFIYPDFTDKTLSLYINKYRINSFLNLFLIFSLIRYNNKEITVDQVIDVIEAIWGNEPNIFKYKDPNTLKNALFHAVNFNNMSLIDYLIKKGCNKNDIDYMGYTYIDYMSPELAKEFNNRIIGINNDILPPYSE